MKPYDKPAKRAAITLLCVLSGNALLAFLVAAFIIPHDIIMGGTTGIGIVLHKAIPQMDVSLFVLILNAILLLIGLIALGKKFALTTVASSLLYPVFLGFFQRIPGIDTMTDNALIAAFFAGALMGVALGLVMRVGSSTGGMDIVTLVLNKYTHMPVSIWVYITDIIVIGGQALFNPAEKTLLGIIVLVLETIVLDKAMILGKSQIQIFVISEAYEQIRNSVGHCGLNVKIAATHGGITVGEDGATHQCLEDVSLMRNIPGMVVCVPSDYVEAKEAVKAAIEHEGPVFLRFGRSNVPVINDRADYKFELGKGVVLKEGSDVTIIGTGVCVDSVLQAEKMLAEEGINAQIVNIHTIKPIDEELITQCAIKTGKIVTVEEHSVIGGLGSVPGAIGSVRNLRFRRGADEVLQTGCTGCVRAGEGISGQVRR